MTLDPSAGGAAGVPPAEPRRRGLRRFFPLEGGSIALIRRLFAESARDYVGRFAIAFGLLGLVALATAGAAWITKDIVDGIFFERDRSLLVVIPLTIGGLFILRGFAAYGANVILARTGNRIVARLQKRLFDRILAFDVQDFARIESSDLINRMSRNATAARDVINGVAGGFGRDFLTLVALLAVMVIQSPLMSLIAFTAGPIAIIGVTSVIRRIRRIARAEFHSLGQVIAAMQETAAGIRIIKAFNLEPLMRRRMDTAIEDVRERADKIAVVGARTGPIMETFGGIAVGAITLWAGYAVLVLGAAPGSFMAFTTAMLLAYEPATRLARLQVQIEQNLVGVRLMYELLDLEPALAADPDAPALAVARGEIAFDEVDFAYPGKPPLFRGLSFVAGAGETTALVGPSGAGKSTVIALLERFFAPGAGRVLIDGQDIAAVEVASLRHNIALVSQDVQLFRGTVRDNIRFGRPDASDIEVETAAAGAMAADFIRALPHGYDTEVGEGAAQLSGGQRQRLAIARAMLRDAPIVLLDEATSALDSESEHQVQLAFDHLKRGRTTLVIAHRLSTVLNADRILVFVDGMIVEDGRHADLLAAGRQYARLYRLQFDHELRRAEAALAAARRAG